MAPPTRLSSAFSPDPVKRVKKFAEKYDLGFALLADEDHAVAEAYGVWVEKSMYGRTYWGNERTTFVIDPDGRAAEVLRRSSPPSTTTWSSPRS
jgi:thioredoxin-dependent peroxiredoxin